jgi:hypothetical protein
MGTEIERRAPSQDIELTWRVAKGFALSGYFTDAATAEKAFVKIMAGAEMGLAPFQSMKGIDIIKGNPFLKPALLRGLLDNSDEYDYEIAWEDDACTVSIFKGGKHRGDSRFSMDDAVKAGLAEKESYQKFERNMLLERATSNAVRWYAPGLTMGPVFIVGEEVPDVLPPHIEALDSEPRADVIEVQSYVSPDDPMDDVPFLPESAAPDASHPSENSAPPPESVAAEPLAAPGANGEGLTIDTLEHAQRLVNLLSSGEQLATMKRMLGLDGKTTRRLMAEALFKQREGWDADDILRDLAGW